MCSSASPKPEESPPPSGGTVRSGGSSSDGGGSLSSRTGSLASLSRQLHSSNINDNTDYERDYAEAEQPASAVPSSPAVTFTVSEVQPDTATESDAKANTIRDLQVYTGAERQPVDDG